MNKLNIHIYEYNFLFMSNKLKLLIYFIIKKLFARRENICGQCLKFGLILITIIYDHFSSTRLYIPCSPEEFFPMPTKNSENDSSL